MNYLILQFVHLENLLAEAVGADALRVHVLEKTRTTTTYGVTWQEITLGLCVRAIAPGQRVLSWYHPIDKFRFYAPEQPSGQERSPEQERYEAAWHMARQLQSDLVQRLRQDEYTVTTDGLMELDVTNYLLGVTELIPLPAASARTQTQVVTVG